MIKIDGISKTFRSGRGIVAALTQISFNVTAGDTLAIVGKSGSGKTTLLNCIGGLEQPESGRISCFGIDIHSLPSRQLSKFQREYLGFVFQFGNLISYLTVSENIAFPLMLNKKAPQPRVRNLLEKIDLLSAADAMPDELSGGEIQRVAFARAIAHSPRLLIADEPTANLDTTTGQNLIDLMTSTATDENCTIILSTHDPDLVSLVDQTIRLQDGVIQG